MPDTTIDTVLETFFDYTMVKGEYDSDRDRAAEYGAMSWDSSGYEAGEVADARDAAESALNRYIDQRIDFKIEKFREDECERDMGEDL